MLTDTCMTLLTTCCQSRNNKGIFFRFGVRELSE